MFTFSVWLHVCSVVRTEQLYFPTYFRQWILKKRHNIFWRQFQPLSLTSAWRAWFTQPWHEVAVIVETKIVSNTFWTKNATQNAKAAIYPSIRYMADVLAPPVTDRCNCKHSERSSLRRSKRSNAVTIQSAPPELIFRAWTIKGGCCSAIFWQESDYSKSIAVKVKEKNKNTFSLSHYFLKKRSQLYCLFLGLHFLFVNNAW